MTAADRNVMLYPWFRFAQNLLFWQAVWFLFFQTKLSAAEAIALYAIYDIGTTLLEVPSGYMSDRLGRRVTLVASCVATGAGALLLFTGDGFAAFALAQVLLGAGSAFVSGTDTSLLYESLAASGRTDETEAQELRGWRFAFSALALSAVSGGALARWDIALPFAAAALAAFAALLIALRFVEPSVRATTAPTLRETAHLVRAALVHPVLAWLFALAVLMYGFSHIPFVFGQPFILDALAGLGLSGEAPLISGAVTTVMMLVSLGASLLAPGMRRRLGLAGLLLLAFAMQIGLVAVLAATGSAIAIAALFLRMVPDSLSRPFLLARIQPLLPDGGRATYLSVQSLCGRIVLAGSLLLAARAAPADSVMAHADLRAVLGTYAAAGLLALGLLALAARRVRIGRD